MGEAIRAVIDTSSLVSARLRRELQTAAQVGAFTAYWSPWIIAELNRVLTWRWVRHTASDTSLPDLSRANERRCSEAAHTMMELLLATFMLVDTPPPHPPVWEQLTDQWDHPVWAAAKASKAHYVVSENTRDFPPKQDDGRAVYEEIEYVTAATFLNVISGTDLGQVRDCL